MLSNYRRQIFFTLILFVIVLFVTTTILTVRLVEKQQKETIRQTLLSEVSTVAMLMPRTPTEPEKLAKQLRQISGARVTFIDTNGVVLADSHESAKTMDNHANRPEIIAASKQPFGTSTRMSNTTDKQTMYVAVALRYGNTPSGYVRLSKSLAEVEATSAIIVRYLMLGLCLLFIISAWVSWTIARSLSRPIHELREVANYITKGDYTRRVNYEKNNEIGQLGHSINEMADSMQLQMKQITDSEGRLKNVLDHLLVGVALTNDTGDILVYNPFLERFSKDRALQGMKLDELHVSPEFVQYWRSALEKKSDVAFEWRTYFPDERIIDVHFIPIASGMLITLHDLTSIRRLENMRSEFVANVSHELRTPLAAIRGFSETLKLGALQDPETASSFLQIILDESDRLNRLVNDLLDLSKIESHRLPLKYEQITLAPLVAEIIQLLEQQMKAKQLTFEISGELQVTVEADRDRLRQIIINLLHNSIQYTHPNGKVLIAWETTQDKLQISVSDSGIGIPHEDLPHVFERFFRVDRARSRQSGGTGLGLSITKHLVEMHKGHITVSSELERGSTFLITLPLKAYDHEH